MQDKAKRRPGEVLFALALAIFSATAFWQSWAISGFKGLATAGTFPMLASAAMLASSVVVLAATVGNSKSGTPQTGGSQPATSILPPPVIITAALVAAYVLLMPLFGFVLSSGTFLFAAFWYLWRRGWLVSLGLTLLSLAAIHTVFRLVFQVVLPEGSLVRGLF